MNDKLQNLAYQSLWYGCYAKKYSLKGVERLATIPDVYADRILKQFEIAERWVGGPDGVFIGDSNAESMAEWRDMIRFDSVVINIAKSGAQLQQWIYFLLHSPKGLQILAKLQKPGLKILTNLGGNDIIQNAFAGFPAAVKKWKELFPASWVVGIPPIDYVYMAQGLPFGPDKLKEQVLAANDCWREAYPQHFIDVFALFADRQGNVKKDVLQDPVHYNQLKQQMLIDNFYDRAI